MIDRSASVGTRIESETNAAASHLITGVFYRYEAIGRPFIRRSVGVHVRVRLVFGGQRRFRAMRRARRRHRADACRSSNIYGGQSQISGVRRAPFD